MADWLQQLTSSPAGQRVVTSLGVPSPTQLRRHAPGDPLVDGPVLVGAAPGSRGERAVGAVLDEAGADIHTDLDGTSEQRYAALIFDATGIADTAALRPVYDFFHPAIRRMGPSSRLLVIGGIPSAGDSRFRAAQRALEGFVRAVGKELRLGSTANLIRAGDGAEDGLASTLRFFLSGRSAFVSGQVVALQVGDEQPATPQDWEQALSGKAAVVTGAARGIGAAIADTLAHNGAHVVAIDVPAQGEALSHVANRIGGSALQLDITAQAAPRQLTEHLAERHGGVDIVVHNAGITRDKTLAGMDAARWDAVIDVNLSSQERLNAALLDGATLREHGRIICISSLSGIAGNRGQTNYAASKAGVIGMVEGLAQEVASRRATINAVAPGFIETAMTTAMPFVMREAGRRMNSLTQGGQPEDVAETVAWLAEPATAYVNGSTIRVCGQSLLGA